MKIYIVGFIGSGKSTLTWIVSELIGIPCHHLDKVVYIEDAGRECFTEGMRQTDIVILLEISLYVRTKRILLR